MAEAIQDPVGEVGEQVVIQIPMNAEREHRMSGTKVQLRVRVLQQRKAKEMKST